MKTKTNSRWLISVIISILVFILLLVTESDIGVTWDEPAYIASSESYMGWFAKLVETPSDAIKAQEITNSWQINSEHPPLDKIWSGAIWSMVRGFTEHPTAHRMGNMILAAVLFGILFNWVQEVYGDIAGFAAVAALLTMPRFFFHAHLSSLDVPAAFSVFVTTYIFWKIKDYKKWTWGILLGVVWGLALATKINAIFIPFTLGLWWLIFSRKANLFVRLILMGLIAIPVFLAVWPWLYTNTIERLVTYIGFVTTNHWQIGQYYLGQFYMPPPWHFGFVMVFAVVPLSLTILFFTGVFQNLSGRKDNGLN